MNHKIEHMTVHSGGSSSIFQQKQTADGYCFKYLLPQLAAESDDRDHRHQQPKDKHDGRRRFGPPSVQEDAKRW